MAELRVREEFDAWARRGRGEEMAAGHGDVTRQALERVDLGPQDRALDIGCGTGWAARMMRERGAGEVWGVDISAEMIARAPDAPGVHLRVASATSLPFPDAHFTRVLSVEAIYYVPDIAAALREARRVCAAGARMLCVVDLFADNPGSLPWAREFDFPVHVLSHAQYETHFRAAGFARVESALLRDSRPILPRAEFQPSQWFADYDTYRHYREIGSLLIDATA